MHLTDLTKKWTIETNWSLFYYNETSPGWSCQAANDCHHRWAILRENCRRRDDDEQTNICQICYSRWVGNIGLFFLCRDFCICPFLILSFSLGWTSKVCLFVLHLKDHFGSIHSNEQNFLKQRYLWFERSQKWIDPFPILRTVRAMI